MVNFLYISQDKKKRVPLYFNFDIYERLRLGKILQRTNNVPNKEQFDKRTVELENQWKGLSHDYSVDRKGRVRSWSNKNLREMSGEIGQENIYDLLYVYLCYHVHSCSLTANEYILGKSSDCTVSIEIGLNDNFIDEVINTTSAILDEITETIKKEIKI